MNSDLAEIQEVLSKYEVACACVMMEDGRMIEYDCCCRCQRLVKED